MSLYSFIRSDEKISAKLKLLTGFYRSSHKEAITKIKLTTNS